MAACGLCFWANTTRSAYEPLERVTRAGGVYECITSAAAGEAPPSAKWMKISDDISTLVPKTGRRGLLAGSETAQELANSQTITIESPDCINLDTSGAVKLAFTPGWRTDRAVKAISLKAEADTALSIEGAAWQNNGTSPEWGTAGNYLVLIAHFVGGRVVLSVSDNTEA